MAEPSATGPDRTSQAGLTFSVAALVGLASAVLHLVGSAYLTTFFNQFHVALVMVELPFPVVVTAGVFVFAKYWYVVIATLVAGYAILILLRWQWPTMSPSLGRLWRTALVSPIFAILAALLIAGLAGPWLAVAVARQDFITLSTSGLDTHPRVRVLLPASVSGSPAQSAALASGCYRLLLQSDGRLMVFFAPPGRRSDRFETEVLPFTSPLRLQTLHTAFIPEGCSAFETAIE
jgi:hypothetical protein